MYETAAQAAGGFGLEAWTAARQALYGAWQAAGLRDTTYDQAGSVISYEANVIRQAVRFTQETYGLADVEAEIPRSERLPPGYISMSAQFEFSDPRLPKDTWWLSRSFDHIPTRAELDQIVSDEMRRIALDYAIDTFEQPDPVPQLSVIRIEAGESINP